MSALQYINVRLVIAVGLLSFAAGLAIDTQFRIDRNAGRDSAALEDALTRALDLAAPGVRDALAAGEPAEAERRLGELAAGQPGIVAALLDPRGLPLMTSAPLPSAAAFATGPQEPGRIVARRPLGTGGLEIALSADRSEARRTEARRQWVAAGRAFGLALLITLACGLLVTRQFARTTQRLTGLLHRLGDLGHPPGKGECHPPTADGEQPDPGRAFRAATDKLSQRLKDLEQARDVLAERGDYLEVTLRAIGDAVIVADAGGRVSAMNAMAEQLCGWSEHEAAGKPLDVVFSNETPHAPGQEALSARALAAVREGEPLSCEALLHARTGETLRVAVTAGPIRMREERHGTVLAFRDITEEAALREALEASERRLLAAVDGGRIGIWEWDARTDAFDHAGPWVEHFSDRVAGGIRTGDALVSVTHPDDREASRAELVRHLKGEIDVYAAEQRILQRDDSYRHFLIRGRVSERSPEGEALRVVGTYTDVTELRSEQQRLEVALAFGRQGLYEWRPQEDELTLSDSWYAHFGHPPGSITNMREQFAALVHPEDQAGARKAVVDALRGVVDYEAEFRMRAGDGSNRWVLARGAIDQRDAEGRAVHTIGTHLDITELKRTQERLQLAFEATRQGFMEWWPREDRLVPDASWYRLTGYGPEDVPSTASMMAEGRVHPQDLDRLSDLLESLASGARDTGTAEYRLRFRSGEYHWLLASGRVADRDADGQVSRVVGTVLDVTTLKHAEQQVQLAVEAARQGIWEWLPESDGFVATRSWTRLFGYDPDTFTTMSAIVQDVIHPEDAEQAVRLMEDLRDGGRDAGEMELRMRRADGDYLWAIARAFVTSRGIDGRAARVIGTDFDITELKLTEQSLDMSVKAARQGMLEWRPLDDRLLPARSWLQLTGYAPGDVVSLSQIVRLHIVHPDDAGPMQRLIDSLLANQTDDISMEMRIKLRSGEYLWVLARAFVADRDPSGRPLRVISTHIDISELKHAEERLKLAVESSRQGLWQWIPQGDRLEPLTNWLQLTGYEASEVPSMAVCYARGIVHEDDQKLVISELEALTYGERDSGEIEFRIRGKDGEYFWALTRIVAAERGPDGQARRIIGTNIDITERRAVEERLNVALEASRQGTWEWTLADDRFYPDARWHQLFQPAEGTIRTMQDVVEHLVHPADQARARAVCEQSLSVEMDHAEAEFRLRTPDGRYIRTLARSVVAERDTDFVPVRLVGTTIDISRLKDAETLISLAVESAKLGLWEWLPPHDELRFPDDSWTRLTGIPTQDVRGVRDLLPRQHPDDARELKARMQGVLDGTVEETEFVQRFVRDDGSYLWLLSRGKVIERDEQNRAARMVGTSYDITELKETERELESSRAFLRLVLDTVPDSIFWKDTDSRYLGANRRFAEHAGFEDPQQIVGLSDRDLDWDHLADELRAEDSRIIQGLEDLTQVERPIVTALNRDMWVSTTKVPLRGDDGEPMGLLGVFHDITAYRHTLEDLKAQRDRLELVIGATGVGIWSVEFAAGRLHLDARACEMIGYERDELAGETLERWAERIHPDDLARVTAEMAAVAEDPEGRFENEYRVQHRLGHWVWLHDNGRVTERDDEGRPVLLSGLVIDATERAERDSHLRTIAEAVTLAQDGTVLRRLVRAARELADVAFAFVGSLNEDDETITAIASWPPDSEIESMRYPIAGSPCENVVEGDLCIYPEDVATRFPADPGLREMGIEAYAGRRLLDESGHARGLFVLLDKKPFGNIERVQAVLDILASTAANELDRERRSQTLTESERRYRQTYERIPILLCTLDGDGRVVDVNEAWCRATGRDREACLGRSVHTFFARSAAPLLDRALARVPATDADAVRGGNEHLELIGADDHLAITTWSLFSGGRVGNREYRILALEDVTARVRVQEQLRIAATAFETHGAIVVTDRERRILQVNEAFTELTQYAQAEVTGTTPDLLKSRRHDEHFYREIWYEVEQFGRWEGEMWGRRKDGSEFPVWQAITSVYDDEQALTHFVINMLDITDRVRAEREIERLAFYDPLTGLANRRYLLDRLEVAIVTARRRDRHGALLFIDLDHFKHINDSMGHSVGDAVLVQAAQRLQHMTRQEDVVCRLGGDEFIVLIGEAGTTAGEAHVHAEAVVQKIRECLSEPFVVERQEFHITPTLGVAFFPGDAEAPADVLKQADSAMYQGKTEGRNTWRYYDPEMAARATERMELENELRTAIEAGELDLHFQPQISAESGVIGAEALVRWMHPTRGFVPPDKFIPIAEDSALIHDVGRFVIDRALEVAQGWLRDGLTFIDHVSINVSSRQFRAPDFVEDLERRRANFDVPARYVVLELTEHTVIDDMQGTIAKMKELRSLGFRFSIDDFGIGYSSLAYLRRLPLDQLKIDRSFVLDVVDDADAGVIAETIIAMGRQLGLETIAEGVETDSQRDFLVARGCGTFQGYLYCRPVPEPEFRAFCREFDGTVVTP